MGPEMDPSMGAQDPAMGPSDMGGDPGAMGEDPNAMPEDPNAIGGDPNAMGGDPSSMPEDPNTMPEEPEMDDSDEDSGKKDIQRATGELSQLLNDYSEPDEELDKYVKGMIDSALENRKDSSESDEESMEGTPEGQGMNPMAGPTMESVIFTKRQMKKLQEGLNPVADEEDSKEPENLPKRKKKTVSKKSPFNAPKFK